MPTNTCVRSATAASAVTRATHTHGESAREREREPKTRVKIQNTRTSFTTSCVCARVCVCVGLQMRLCCCLHDGWETVVPGENIYVMNIWIESMYICTHTHRYTRTDQFNYIHKPYTQRPLNSAQI